jgi:hypothetical protein
MAVPTTYYNLLKPGTGETYDVNLLDTNYDKIDAALNLLNTTPNKEDNQLVFNCNGITYTAATVGDCGVLHIDTGTAASSQLSNPQPTFAQPGSVSGSIKFLQAGIYDIQWYNTPSANPGNQGFIIQMNGTWPGPPDSANSVFCKNNVATGSQYWESTTIALGVRVPTANLEVKFTGILTNGVAVASHIKVIQRSKF